MLFLASLATVLTAIAFIVSFFVVGVSKYLVIGVVVSLVLWAIKYLYDMWFEVDGFLSYLLLIFNAAIFFVSGFLFVAGLIKWIFKLNILGFLASIEVVPMIIAGLILFVIGLLCDRSREIF